ncbi:MAG: endolytic transglycosylase MltG [Clostridiales bacterium]|nr:endolytic transglycosylase MltG [Clostridiales bacterium]
MKRKNKFNLKKIDFMQIKDNFAEFIKNSKTKVLLWFGNFLGTGKNTKKTWQILRPWSIYLISFLLVITIFTCAISIVLNSLFGSYDKRDKTPVLFTINEGASMSYVATKLEDAKLIKSSLGIKLLADFTSVSSKIQNGEYVLDRTMSVQDILDVITKSSTSAKVVSVTLVEGMTVEDFAEQLKSAGVISSVDSFLNECKNAKAYSDYYFVKPLYDNGNLKYNLEGYLFPDTYEFYAGSSNDVVIKKLLSRLNSVYTVKYTERADELKLSMHQVITLASLIEKEGKGEDFKKISAVFHNRIKKGMKLESDVTVQYALDIKKLVLTADQLKTQSPYNTYVVTGIPAGPICNPGKDAIEAVLYPDNEILNGGYLYFTLTDPYTGAVAYSKTYEEHVKIKNQYQPVWQAYDKAQGN